MISRQESLETPPKLNVTAWRDPVIEAAGHRPGSPYVETVWLAILGPGSTFGWHRLARIAAASKSTVTIDAGELAASIGLGTALGRNAPISRTLARLEAFGTLRRAGDTVGVRLALPDVPERRAAKLCPSAQVAHRRFAHPAPVTHPGRPGAGGIDRAVTHWYDQAACKGVPPSVFFPDDDQADYALARRLCANCPVREPCLEDAQRARVNHGMFGGLTPKERRAARRGAA